MPSSIPSAKRLHKNDLLSIGELSARTGLSVSAIRFYERKRLVEPLRTSGNQRRFLRSDIRRLSFVLIAQRLGLGLAEIEAELSRLPHGRTPNAHDWKRISGRLQGEIEGRIARLRKVAENLDGCIGCGCLSLTRCQLFNKGDSAATGGPGPRVLR
jgi:MerR family redox-sensitive transcriptional activator SoxR